MRQPVQNLRYGKRRHLAYLQVDLFDSEWASHGIDWEMRARLDAVSLQNTDVRLSHADSIRENFWLDKIENSIQDGAVLIICGFLHLDFLASNIHARCGIVAEKCTYPASLLGRIPDITLSPDDLKEYLREPGDAARI